MTTLDDDWVCDEGGVDSLECYAIWGHCEECHETKTPFYWYSGGLVSLGQGLNIKENYGNLWWEHKEQLEGHFDICSTCTGSGGGYYCGVHQ